MIKPSHPPRARNESLWRRLSRKLVTLFYVFGLVVVFGLFSTMTTDSGARSVPYTEFKQWIRAGKVMSVTVDANRVRGTLKNDEKPTDTGQRFVAIRIDDPGLVAELERHQVSATGEITSQWWNGLVWLLPLALLMWFLNISISRLGQAPGGAVAFGRSRAKIYAESDVKVTFVDVAGIDEATEELREIVDFLQKPQKYTDLGGHIPKGVLLVGPPGTGKTLLARATAGEARVPFFSLSGSEFVEMFVGVGAARVRDLFAQAEAKAPCIVFIDELDAIGKVRGVSTIGGHEEREQTLNQLLAEMDGFDPRKGIVVMSATNRPEVLDPALLRPGRFDRRVVVDRPDVRGREAILRLHARTVKVAQDVDLQQIAARTTGFAGADLANLVNEATLLAARRDRRQVSLSDFEEAIDRVLAGLKRKRAMSPHEREIVAAHEAGHAIVASVLPGVDPVHKISIVQRGYDALGHTLQLPQEDRYLRTRRELVNQLAVWMGGRAAEEVAVHEISTGGHDDLRRASDLARAMVAEYGMSDAIGPVATATREPPPCLRAPVPQEARLAEDTAREIDLEVKRLMIEAYALARSTIGTHRAALKEISRRLLEHEVVNGDEVRRLLAADPDSTSHAA
jgi:cell division protease FtsH